MAGRPKTTDADGRQQIAMVTDILLNLGASWPDIRNELFRFSQTQFAKFKDVPSESTLERLLLEHFECDNMTMYREKRKDSLKIQLKNKAVTMALAGNVSMLIFCLKNLCGWSDNVQPVPEPEEAKNRIRLAYDPKRV